MAHTIRVFIDNSEVAISQVSRGVAAWFSIAEHPKNRRTSAAH
jgi:hypothetical protein